MRSLLSLSVAAALGIAALGLTVNAYGQTAADVGDSVRIYGAQPKYKLDTAAFQHYRGTYLMSDGKRLQLSAAGKRFYASIDDQPRFEIVPVGHNAFVARASGTRFLFDEFQGRRTHDVVMTMPASSGRMLLGAR